MARNIGNGYIEIYFEDFYNRLIPVSKMGSGIKTILLVLLQLLIVPEIENIRKDNLVFGFEELENNLHPSLQRKLFNYLLEYSRQSRAYFFITTHSSVVIDLFGSSHDAQLIHIQNQGEYSTVKCVNRHYDSRHVLRDLEFKASDLLLSNGVMWVEGPSDAIYLQALIDMFSIAAGNPNFGKLNYTIQCLSTAIWKYAGFDDFDWSKVDESIENKIISLAKINHNHLIIIDKDNNYEDKKPSEWQNFLNGVGKNKARLIYESIKYSNQSESSLINNYGDTNNSQLLFWVTDGTFESYLEYFVSHKGEVDFKQYFDTNKTRGYFEKLRSGNNSSISKVELAAKIAMYCNDNKLSFEDFAPKGSVLAQKINRLMETIRSWNY